MTKRAYFGTDGIRGEANRHPMTAEVALRVGLAAGKQLNKPRPLGTVTFGKAHDRHGADDQHLAQVLMPGLGDAAEPLLAAAGVLPRHQADPRGEVAA